MIHMHIVIHGDNLHAGTRTLEALIDQVADCSPGQDAIVYRAWAERVEQYEADSQINSIPRQVR